MKQLSITFVLLSFFHAVTATAQEFELPEIMVEGSSPDAYYLESLPSVTRLSGKRLERKKQSTVGETLSREPGVSSTFFGPNASRPIIRGLDGDRIRLMENGTGTLDASSVSPDHAVSVDPLLVDGIDIIRGPSALLYGNTAIGGVVNVRTKRIANRMHDANELKMAGHLSSVDRGRTLGLMGRVKAGSWIMEADVSGRGAEDYSAPGRKIVNSANRTFQEGVGATFVTENSHVGASLSAIQSRYGTIAESTVLIDLERFRLDVEAEKKMSGWIETARLKGAGSVYRHQEIDEGRVGTTFRNKGGELRGDFSHLKVGEMDGSFGFQAQLFQISATGDEAFLPSNLNQSYAVFIFEEWKLGNWKPSAGLRMNESLVRATEEFNSQSALSRSFFNPSASFGLAYEVSPEASTGVNFTYTERAPNNQELFADGVHIATRVYERGNRNLHSERSVGAEVFYKEKTRWMEMKTSLFAQKFNSFLALSPTSETFTDPTTSEVYSIYSFNSVSALLTGAEVQWSHELPFKFWGGFLEVELQADFVRGIDLTHSGNLPRIPPIRETIGFNYRNLGWNSFIQLQRNEKQGLLAANETPTDAFTFVNAGFDGPFTQEFGGFRWSFRVSNIFDREGRVHTSFLKDLAPLPGRNFILGVQAAI